DETQLRKSREVCDGLPPFGHVISRQDFSSSNENEYVELAYSLYPAGSDFAGRLEQISQTGTSGTHFDLYDGYGRVIRMTVPWKDSGARRTITFGYDSTNERRTPTSITESLGDSGGGAVTVVSHTEIDWSHENGTGNRVRTEKRDPHPTANPCESE